MTYLILITALLIPHIALARIGENREECDRRYGKPYKVMDEMLFYEKSGVKIHIQMWKGKVHYIRYHDDGRWSSPTQHLTKSFIWELLKKNFPTKTGEEVKALYDKGDYKWDEHLQKEGYDVLKLWANSGLSGGYLKIYTNEFRSSAVLKKQKMKLEADAKALIKGF
ncbi:hypothetical protein N9H14_02215 [bacterium]|nr:hypothetical protein [Akkermansiaceae bacterium]MDA8980976.1 hypothetical protein [bacterium]